MVGEGWKGAERILAGSTASSVFGSLGATILAVALRRSCCYFIGNSSCSDPVDENLHWCYNLPGYTQYSIANDGVPIVSHLHGGHTDFQFDGNPEFFFSPGYAVKGPQSVDKTYLYDNSQPAGNLWYHDHALGISRLNV